MERLSICNETSRSDGITQDRNRLNNGQSLDTCSLDGKSGVQCTFLPVSLVLDAHEGLYTRTSAWI